MNAKFTAVASLVFALTLTCEAPCQMQAQDDKTPYPSMAPLDQYLMTDRNAEIALARSAAPDSISSNAEVLVFGRKGYETAIKGKNGFVCLVGRSWSSPFDDPEFWNPKVRAPICYNPPAARSVLPIYIQRTQMALAGLSKARVISGIKAAYDKKELPIPAPGSMCYMMSKQAYFGDSEPPLSHLMFELPPLDAAAWGANLPGSPVILGVQGVSEGAPEPMTEFVVPVGNWSDGTPAAADYNSASDSHKH